MDTAIDIGRRRVVAGGLASASVSAIAAPASALSAATGDTAYVFELLDNALWIPDGLPNAKHAYVIGAPWCPVCRQFYADSRPFINAIQLRWIMALSTNEEALRQNRALDYRRSPRDLAAIYTGNDIGLDVPDSANWAQRWDDGVQNAMAKFLIKRQPGSSGNETPRHFWLSKKGGAVASIAGGVNLSQLVAATQPRPEARELSPRGLEFLRTAPKVRSINRRPVYAGANGQDFYAVPSLGAPVVEHIENNQGLPAEKVATYDNGDKWVGFAAGARWDQPYEIWAPMAAMYSGSNLKADF